MHHHIGARGEVVIPKALRERAGLKPGVLVEFRLDGRSVSVAALAEPSRGLSGRFAQSGMAARLHEDRAAQPS
jgi:AbrB family looped-hinge helix DNA binding protein